MHCVSSIIKYMWKDSLSLRRFLSVFALLLAGAVGPQLAAQQSGSKEAWAYTPAEREQMRRDPGARRQRLAADLPHNGGAADVIDGAKHPELYFVTHLFETLVRLSFVALPRAYPHVVRDRTTDLFLEPREWDTFSEIVTAYADILRREHSLAESLDRAGVEEQQALKCEEGARALRAARKTFGRARFDRMLYEVVAVGLSTSYSRDTNLEKAAHTERERDERCQ
jgi:hypothetical protein